MRYIFLGMIIGCFALNGQNLLHIFLVLPRIQKKNDTSIQNADYQERGFATIQKIVNYLLEDFGKESQ